MYFHFDGNISYSATYNDIFPAIYVRYDLGM